MKNFIERKKKGDKVASWYPLTLTFLDFETKIQDSGRRGLPRGCRDLASEFLVVLATGARRSNGDSLSMLTNVRYERGGEKRRNTSKNEEVFPTAGSHTNNDGGARQRLHLRGSGFFSGEAIFLYYLDDASRAT